MLARIFSPQFRATSLLIGFTVPLPSAASGKEPAACQVAHFKAPLDADMLQNYIITW